MFDRFKDILVECTFNKIILVKGDFSKTTDRLDKIIERTLCCKKHWIKKRIMYHKYLMSYM